MRLRLPDIAPYIIRVESTWKRRVLLSLVIVPASILYSIDQGVAHFFKVWIGSYHHIWKKRN